VSDNDAGAKRVVALVSPCGYGNLGDAAIIDSVIAAIRKRLGDIGIVAFTMNPDDTTARHGIEAHPVLGFSRPFYPVQEQGGARRGFGGRSGDGPDLLAWAPPLRKLRTFGAMMAAQRAHEATCRERLSGCRLVIVAGGGQLDEFWGGPLGHPFALWRWARLARRVGARYAMLSVGTGTLATRLGKRFARAALAAADYRSFRDEGSRALAGNPPRAAVVPDLAYAVPLPPRTDVAPRARKLVAVSPISYRDPRNWPNKSPEAYTLHVRTMATFVARLAAEGYDVSLFATDSSDWATVADVQAELPATNGADSGRIERAPTDSVAALLAFLATADLVVACRLHAVLLSHVVGIPVVAVSYERKVATLMRETGQAPYGVAIENFRIEDAVHTVRLALGERALLARDIGARVGAFRQRVENQYDEVLTS
jgi:polysaccharide pyruvyl transferase WcaK-like protein